MANDWILDVLADLKKFAASNDLGALAAQLDETALVAAHEIASIHRRAPALIGAHASKSRMVHRTTGVGDKF
ncbi:hypothetical protein [Oceaniglobus ichthyenteri]|uniref:hypothetical protein n=1 Tax=Oceaniglobus ichthyenteri TaxID=2136177 RepID=UPI000D3B7668|nr:hypothetical protein [Oceaniglobus ichthyenteri]